jgi:signal peptidase II
VCDAARWFGPETVLRRLAAAPVIVAERGVDYARLGALIGLVTAPTILIDQASKLYIINRFRMYETWPLIRNWLDLTYTLNPGAAFSLFATMPAAFRSVFFIVLSIIAIVVLATLMARRETARLSGIAFALILGGTIGNLIDRMGRGRVVDFIYFHHSWLNYPVFNVADSAITVGVSIFILYSTFSGRPAEVASPQPSPRDPG